MGSSKSKAAPPRAARGSIRRAAISAEAIDPEKLASFEKKKYPKSEVLSWQMLLLLRVLLRDELE